MRIPQVLRVHAALIAVSLIYGFFYVSVKLILQDITEQELLLLRFVLTAMVVFVLDRLFFKTSFKSAKDFWKVAGWGFLGVFLVQIGIITGVHRTTVFHSALIMATVPIMTLFFSILLNRETFHIQKLVGILIAFSGVAVLLFFTKNPDTPLPETYLIGDLVILASSMAFSLFLIGSQQMLKEYQSFPFMAWCYVISGLAYTMMYSGGAMLHTGVPALSFLGAMQPVTWLLVGYVVLFASIASYTLNNYALRRVNPSVVSVYLFIQPVISAVLGFYLLDELFNMSMAMATGITFIGVLMATTASHKGFYLRKKPGDVTPLHPEMEETTAEFADLPK